MKMQYLVLTNEGFNLRRQTKKFLSNNHTLRDTHQSLNHVNKCYKLSRVCT